MRTKRLWLLRGTENLIQQIKLNQFYNGANTQVLTFPKIKVFEVWNTSFYVEERNTGNLHAVHITVPPANKYCQHHEARKIS